MTVKIMVLYFLFLTGKANAQAPNFAIHFKFNKYAPAESEKKKLDSFILSFPPGATMNLYGHCDIVGSNSYNDALSLKRVWAVKAYLVKKHLPETSIAIVKGYGKRKPLGTSGTAFERMQNRRVEIFIRAGKSSDDDKKINEQLEDTAIKTGNILVLQNMNFVGARHQLLPESFTVLEDLLTAMKKNPTLAIQVQGHICCLPGNIDGFDIETGSSNLSEARARAVWDYLLQHGIEKSRLSYIGLGHSQPLFPYPEKNEQERVMNRRVEILIIHK